METMIYDLASNHDVDEYRVDTPFRVGVAGVAALRSQVSKLAPNPAPPFRRWLQGSDGAYSQPDFLMQLRV